MKTKRVIFFLAALLIVGSISACAEMLEILIGTEQPPATSGGDDGDDAARGPGAPTGVTAERNPADSTNVRVTWNAVSGATGYRVYWSETYSGSGTLKGSPTTTSFTVTGNRTDATHYFRVTAVNSDGEGTASSWISVGPVSSTPTSTRPPAPTGVTAARTPADSTDVRVTWNAVSGATSYRVYYSETGTDSGTREGSPTATSFTSTGNYTDRTHYFRVTAVNSAGEGTPSSWVSVGPVASTGGSTTTLPGTPTGVTAARNPAGSTDVRVSWNAVSGATRYRVYYSTTNSGNGDLEGESTTTSFTCNNIRANTTHYFRVSAVNNAGEGTPSSWVSVGPVASTGGGPTNWTKVSNNPFGNYILEAVTYGNGRFIAGSRGGTMAYSTDGRSWTAVANTRLDESIGGIAYGDNRWVAVERSRIAYSTNNGTSWTAVAVDRIFDSYINAVAWGNGRFVAGSYDGKMAYSTNGASWTAVSNSRFGTSRINGIAYNGSRFVAVGNDGKMAYSADGASWTAVSNSRFDGSEIYGIAYGMNAAGNGRFVAVGYGKLAYSADGITWTAITANPFGEYDDICGIAYGGGRFVAVGWDGIAYADW